MLKVTAKYKVNKLTQRKTNIKDEIRYNNVSVCSISQTIVENDTFHASTGCNKK